MTPWMCRDAERSPERLSTEDGNASPRPGFLPQPAFHLAPSKWINPGDVWSFCWLLKGYLLQLFLFFRSLVQDHKFSVKTFAKGSRTRLYDNHSITLLLLLLLYLYHNTQEVVQVSKSPFFLLAIWKSLFFANWLIDTPSCSQEGLAD